jgi:hypothetical protein
VSKLQLKSDPTTGIGTWPNNEVEIYPNPVSDNLFIKPNSSLCSEITVEIFDTYGRTVLVKRLPAGQIKNTYEVNVNNIPSGLYFLKLDLSDSSCPVVRKIIIN